MTVLKSFHFSFSKNTWQHSSTQPLSSLEGEVVSELTHSRKAAAGSPQSAHAGWVGGRAPPEPGPTRHCGREAPGARQRHRPGSSARPALPGPAGLSRCPGQRRHLQRLRRPRPRPGPGGNGREAKGPLPPAGSGLRRVCGSNSSLAPTE